MNHNSIAEKITSIMVSFSVSLFVFVISFGNPVVLRPAPTLIRYSFLLQVYDNGKLAFFLDGSDTDTSSWMRFIRCARHKEEQNMFAFQHNKSIFYRAFREIPSGTELLVWYDDKYYLQHMGIPVSNWDKDISQHFPGERFLSN